MSELKFKFKMPDDESLAGYISVKGEKGEKGDPTKLSQLENDTGFVAANTTALTNYYTKAQTDSAIDADVEALETELGVPDGFFTDTGETVSGEGSSITLNGTANAVFKDIKFYGNTQQDGTPTPETPLEVQVVTGDQTIIISDNDQQSQSYMISLGGLELCKLGSYRDYIYKGNNGWYIHKETDHVKIDSLSDGTSYAIDTSSTNTTRVLINQCLNGQGAFNDRALSKCNHLRYVSNWNSDKVGFFPDADAGGTKNGLCFRINKETIGTDATEIEAWLNANPLKVYYVLAAATDELITDSVLISQLKAIEKAQSYGGTTGIVISGSLSATLSVKAFTNNWSGTVAALGNEIDELSNRPATETTIGLVKVGDGLEIDRNGELSLEIVPRLRFHSVAASKATYIVELPNGKNMLIDTGLSSQWSDIETAVDGLGIDRFDYAILTHFHGDHVGNVQRFIDKYDMTDCVWYVQMKPDYERMVLDTESAYDAQISLLQTNGFIPIVPTNDSYITIDAENDVKLHFLNTDATIAENYYGRYGEYLSELGVNNNVFSLITEIIHKDVRILATGDIERPVEEQFVDKLGKVNIMTAPHHGTNRDDLKAFYSATMPDFAICSDPDLTDSSIRSSMKGRYYLKEFGSQIISPTHSEAVNGLFSFESDGEEVISHVLGGALTETAFNFNNSYQEIDGLIGWTAQAQSTITLEQLIENLPQGFDMSEFMSNEIRARLPQVTTDIQSLFGLSTIPQFLTIRKRRLFTEITVFDQYISFTATRNTWPDGSMDNWKIKGNGLLNEFIQGQANLLSRLNQLPVGQYAIKGYQDPDSSILVTTWYYALSINVLTNNTTDGVTCKISAIIRNDNETLSYDGAPSAEAYYKSVTAPARLSWRKTS